MQGCDMGWGGYGHQKKGLSPVDPGPLPLEGDPPPSSTLCPSQWSRVHRTARGKTLDPVATTSCKVMKHEAPIT